MGDLGPGDWGFDPGDLYRDGGVVDRGPAGRFQGTMPLEAPIGGRVGDASCVGECCEPGRCSTLPTSEQETGGGGGILADIKGGPWINKKPPVKPGDKKPVSPPTSENVVEETATETIVCRRTVETNAEWEVLDSDLEVFVTVELCKSQSFRGVAKRVCTTTDGYQLLQLVEETVTTWTGHARCPPPKTERRIVEGPFLAYFEGPKECGPWSNMHKNPYLVPFSKLSETWRDVMTEAMETLDVAMREATRANPGAKITPSGNWTWFNEQEGLTRYAIPQDTCGNDAEREAWPFHTLGAAGVGGG